MKNEIIMKIYKTLNNTIKRINKEILTKLKGGKV